MSYAIREVWDLPHAHVGRRVLVYDQIDSTNTRALELAADPANDGVALLADEQVAGRGQHGRRWLAGPRSSVLMSVLVNPPPEVSRPVLLTAWAAVCVCEIARRVTGQPARIKWPNDVLLHGRKVCGILIEQSRLAGRVATVVGIGLNVTQSLADFTAAQLPEATSLRAMNTTQDDTHVLARELLQLLDAEYTTLLRDPGPLEALWKWHLGLLGQPVRVEAVDGVQSGRLVECAFDGLALLQPNGSRVQLRPESVLHVQRA